ncbi:MFS transporter [Oleiagrimonas sp.]|jgi:FHS family glucose/mannose:H+ symporter-like MFS transporter|uniref:MFS transporter n=1 Tax=Oleiagrimonas sp. TaxID=2010330 RepID=UPI00262B5C96|nr:MFS transporter [Oleiagrimonas sp.]MDA3913602.1 MFS transporter [Oleiagrimonas sp.]
MKPTSTSRYLIFFSLGLSYMVYAVLLNSVGTVILQSILSFSISKESGSVLEAFKDLSIAGVSFVTASYLPKLGYRRAMILGHSLVAVACVAMALHPVFGMTELIFAVFGSTFALVKVAVYSSIGLLMPNRQRHASMMNILEGLFMIGMLGGYWLFGAFIDHAHPGDLAWTHVYWVLAVVSLVVVVLLAFSSLDESAAHGDEAGRPAAFMDMLRLMVRPMIYTFIALIFLYELIEQGVGTWLPTFNSEILKLPAAMSVQAASIYAGSLAVGRLSAGLLLRHIHWYKLLNFCLAGMAVLVVVTLPLAAHVPHRPDVTWLNAPLVTYIFPLIGLLMAPIYPVVNSVMLSALPKDRHAGMTGLIVVFSALGGTLGSFITGTVFRLFNGETAFYLTLVPMALILVALFVFRRETRLVPAQG